jgi:catechol 2,3-dioxygenase-like lactoylglutathione lyase family enzyme
MTNFSRKSFLTLSGAAIATAALPRTPFAQETQILLSRIKMATIGAPSIDAVERWYTTWLGYVVIERSNVSVEMADSWGAPKSAGRPFILMQSSAKDDVYIRAVEVDPVPGYKAMTTWGWNAIEIICDDVDALHEELKTSAFTHLAGPANLMGGTSSIRAVQYKGPAEEVIYLTCETGDRSKSTLPLPRGPVDRPFIMVLAGPDLDEMDRFYTNAFRLKDNGFRFTSTGGLISMMQGRPDDEVYQLGLLRLTEKGNNIELDEYPDDTGPRPSAVGQLPPGCAMTTFNCEDLEATGLNYITAPITEYGGKRSATFIGPTGELTELIEEKRA